MVLPSVELSEPPLEAAAGLLVSTDLLVSSSLRAFLEEGLAAASSSDDEPLEELLEEAAEFERSRFTPPVDFFLSSSESESEESELALAAAGAAFSSSELSLSELSDSAALADLLLLSAGLAASAEEESDEELESELESESELEAAAASSSCFLLCEKIQCACSACVDYANAHEPSCPYLILLFNRNSTQSLTVVYCLVRSLD